jgi:hypothetical protein
MFALLHAKTNVLQCTMQEKHVHLIVQNLAARIKRKLANRDVKKTVAKRNLKGKFISVLFKNRGQILF